ncbi:laccase domain-containing protein 1 [Silurus asotus]|uniref:Purine nucleoside phosphorylase LACC1 n=1 Tax=Silurus asotus TaxID=30991 RepID=A0AAD5AQT2_SILAS|nr:laccase domain-containing protein 1 [Silurus asotus]
MAEVILADLVHPNCPGYSQCVETRVNKLLSALGSGTSEPVYLIVQQHAGCSEEITESSLLEKCAGLNRRVHVLTGSSSVAALYAFKRAADQLTVTRVHVMTCSARRAELQECEQQLFTELYTFTYSSVLDCKSCPFAQITNCSQFTQHTQFKEQINDFLQRLPALRGEITLLKSSLIPDCFAHGFTTRTGGISYINTLGSLNLFSSSRRRDSRAVVAENLRRLGQYAGFQPHHFHLSKVNHANDVWVMNKPEPESYDGIVTNQPGVVIAAPGADCMPLLFADTVKKVIGVAHAGWKGTLMGVAMATVNAMVREFGSELANVVAVIGPSVGPCCFILEQNSARKFQTIHPDCVRDMESPMPYVDIRLATRTLLEKGGLLPENIQDNTVTNRPNITLCTSCHPDSFFSHVRDGLNFGTQIGFLWIKEPH